jgi:hypothetical protein
MESRKSGTLAAAGHTNVALTSAYLHIVAPLIATGLAYPLGEGRESVN